jgi:hypothetical protein
MIQLPDELEYKIMFLLNNNILCLVCKNWNNSIKERKKRAVLKISEWYYKRLLPRDDSFDPKNKFELCRKMVMYYSNDCFLNFPSFAADKLNMFDLLIYTQTISSRKQVRDWILNMNITLNEFNYVGW